MDLDDVDTAHEVTSYHEAAHVLVAEHLGGEATSAYATEVEGQIHYDPPLSGDPISDVAVSLAGYVAELALGVDEEVAARRARADIACAWGIANATGRPAESFARGEARARGILLEHREAVASLAERIRGRVFGLRGAALRHAIAAAGTRQAAASPAGQAEAIPGDRRGVRFAAMAAGHRSRRRGVGSHAELTAALARAHTWRRALRLL